MSDKELFQVVFDHFASMYDGLSMSGTMVYYQGQLAFNTDGFSALYNITSLCDILRDEML